jgi:hypothetical protein
MNELLKQSEEVSIDRYLYLMIINIAIIVITTSERDIAKVKLQQDMKECTICFDMFNLQDGYECSYHHFTCRPNG